MGSVLECFKLVGCEGMLNSRSTAFDKGRDLSLALSSASIYTSERCSPLCCIAGGSAIVVEIDLDVWVGERVIFKI